MSKSLKTGDKTAKIEYEVLNKILEHLSNLLPVRNLDLDKEEIEIIKDLGLLTIKPVIYVANVSEKQILNMENDKFVKLVKEYAKKENSQVISLCAKLEEDLSELDDEDKKTLMDDYGIKESGLDKLAKASYTLLGLISYLTAGPKEVRAWTIVNGTKAPGAAGKIHTDFERGFIKAEVVSYDDLISNGSTAKAREKGLVRLEGKEYVVKDGDVIVFRFNV